MRKKGGPEFECLCSIIHNMHVVEQIIIVIKLYNNYSKSFLIFKQFDMKEEVNLRIEYDLLLNKKLILLLAFL